MEAPPHIKRCIEVREKDKDGASGHTCLSRMVPRPLLTDTTVCPSPVRPKATRKPTFLWLSPTHCPFRFSPSRCSANDGDTHTALVTLADRRSAHFTAGDVRGRRQRSGEVWFPCSVQLRGLKLRHRRSIGGTVGGHCAQWGDLLRAPFGEALRRPTHHRFCR